MQADIILKQDIGTGRAFTFIFEEENYYDLVAPTIEKLNSSSRILIFLIPKVTETNWQKISEDLLKKFVELKIRQTSIVGIGEATSVSQNIALRENKLIRSLILIDPTTRAHPKKIDKFISKIEEFLPLGLPLRKNFMGFDSKPFLQRLRCPCLILTTNRASPYIRLQSELIAKRVPTAWLKDLKEENFSTRLIQLIEEFEQVPAKCPQKNLKIN